MARARTTKGLAKRIDLTYYQRMHPFRWWWRVLCFGVVGVGILWLVVEAIRGDQRIYTSGTVSIAHQMIDSACERCQDRKSTRLNSSHSRASRMPSSA